MHGSVQEEHTHLLCKPCRAITLPWVFEPSPPRKAGAGDLRLRSRNDTKELLTPTTPKQITSLLYNPCSYTDTEGARDYSTQITRHLLLLSPSLQGLHKPSNSASAPSRAAFSPYARKASVHGGNASLTQKRQTAINTFLLGATHAVWHFCALFK